jgi:L-fuconolactonase
VIDAHLQLWDRSRSGYPWITPELGPLDRDFGPVEASAELRAAGVDAAILVQADDSASDTRFMLDVAHRHDWVAGVVGWVPLDDTRASAAALDELDAEPSSAATLNGPVSSKTSDGSPPRTSILHDSTHKTV